MYNLSHQQQLTLEDSSFSSSFSSGASSSITSNFLKNAKFHIDSLPQSVFVSTLTRNEPIQLPDSYQPSDYDVVNGRGKGAYMRPGNKRFRAIVSQYVADYVAAKTKFDKSSVMLMVIDRVKEQDNGKAKFVTCKKGQWYEITDEKAREKVGHCLRETLAALQPEASGSSDPSSRVASPSLKSVQKQKQQTKTERKSSDDILELQRAKIDSLLFSTLKNNSKCSFQQAQTQLPWQEQQKQQRRHTAESGFDASIFEVVEL